MSNFGFDPIIFAIGFGVGVVLTLEFGLLRANAIKELQAEAITHGYAERVITDQLKGVLEFRWKECECND